MDAGRIIADMNRRIRETSSLIWRNIVKGGVKSGQRGGVKVGQLMTMYL
jgi:hypothetical protein